MTPARYRKLRGVLDRRQPDLTLLTENVHKSHNISAILRTADAVGIYEAHAISEGGEVPRPPHWSGFRVAPTRMEFWQELPFRYHDRLVFTREGDAWVSGRLFP